MLGRARGDAPEMAPAAATEEEDPEEAAVEVDAAPPDAPPAATPAAPPYAPPLAPPAADEEEELELLDVANVVMSFGITEGLPPIPTLIVPLELIESGLAARKVCV